MEVTAQPVDTHRLRTFRLPAMIIVVPHRGRRPQPGDLVRYVGEELPGLYQPGDLTIWQLGPTQRDPRQKWEVVIPVVIGAKPQFEGQANWLLKWEMFTGQQKPDYESLDPAGGYRYGRLNWQDNEHCDLQNQFGNTSICKKKEYPDSWWSPVLGIGLDSFTFAKAGLLIRPRTLILKEIIDRVGHCLVEATHLDEVGVSERALPVKVDNKIYLHR